MQHRHEIIFSFNTPSNNFAIRLLQDVVNNNFSLSIDSKIPIDFIPNSSRFLLASEAEQSGLSLTWSYTSEADFHNEVT